jgi:hypothetical protein
MAAPQVVRAAIDDWRFDDAMSSITLAAEVLDSLSTGGDLLPQAGLVDILQPRFEGATSEVELEAVKTEAATLLEKAGDIVGPLTELTTATGAWSWEQPRVVRTAISAGRFDDAGTALVPALAALRDLAAAEAALPGSPIHDRFKVAFENADSVVALEELATTMATLRTDAEAAGAELAALETEAGVWKLPVAVSTPLAAGDVSVTLAAVRDARTAIQATSDARVALPEADVPSVIRPLYEAATTGEQLAGVARQATELRDAAVTTGAALDKLRESVGDWTLPTMFTDPVRARDFATARSTITLGQEWVDFARQADARLAGLGAMDAQRQAFEAATSVQDLQAGREVAERQFNAVDAVATAIDRKNDPRDLLTQVGLLGTDLEALTQEALAAARSGDVAKALTYAAQLNQSLSAATQAGGLRLAGLVFLGVAILGVIGLWVVLRGERKPPWARTSKPPWAR